MSSVAEAAEDVTVTSTGQLEMKPMKVQPPEFSKPLNDRAKLTFYEVMSAKPSSPDTRPASAAARSSASSGPSSPQHLHLPGVDSNGNRRPGHPHHQPQEPALVFTPKARRLTIDR